MKNKESCNTNVTQLLNQYFENQIKIALTELGDYTISADYSVSKDLNKVLAKHGFRVYGMAVNPSEFTITLDASAYYYKIDGLPVKDCRFTLPTNGGYHVDIDETVVEENLWLTFETGPECNFSKLSVAELEGFANAMKNQHLAFVLKN